MNHDVTQLEDTFIRALKATRLQKKLTQAQVCALVRAMGVKLDSSYLSRIENGSVRPSFRHALALSLALNIPMPGAEPTMANSRTMTNLRHARKLIHDSICDMEAGGNGASVGDGAKRARK